MALTTRPVQENRFVLSTDWEGYLKFLEAAEDRRIRITYDGGTIELVSPSFDHEAVKECLCRILETFLLETGRDFRNGGSTTFKREALKKGLEPDGCYWIACADDVGPGYDPDVGPPPDLALEVEVTSSALDRLSIYAALGIPELWRYTCKHRLHFLVLRDGGYVEVPSSPIAPELTAERLVEFVQRGLETKTSTMMREVRAWAASVQ